MWKMFATNERLYVDSTLEFGFMFLSDRRFCTIFYVQSLYSGVLSMISGTACLFEADSLGIGALFQSV